MAEAEKDLAGAGEMAAARPRNLEAIAALLGATILFTAGDASMKLVATRLPTGEAVFLRCLLSLVMVTVAAAMTGALATLHRAFVPLMGWRALGDAGSALFFQAALASLAFADIVGILQLTPMSLTAASAIFLGAAVGWRRWSAVAVGLVGALLVIKPGSSAFNAWAVVAVLSVAAGTLRDLCTRSLDRSISPLVIMMLSQAAVALGALAGVVFETWVAPAPLQLGEIAVAATCVLLGHLLIIHSLRVGDIAAVAPFRYAGILWAILLGFVIWGELPDALSVLGIALLIGAGLYTFHRERLALRAVKAAAR